MSTPEGESYAWQPFVFRAESGDVSVKNTFLDGWADEESALARRAAARRLAGTWAGPARRAPPEPESEPEGGANATSPARPGGAPPPAPRPAGRPPTPTARDAPPAVPVALSSNFEEAGAVGGAVVQEGPRGATARRQRGGRRRGVASTALGEARAEGAEAVPLGRAPGQAPSVRSYAAVASGARPAAPRGGRPRQEAGAPAAEEAPPGREPQGRQRQGGPRQPQVPQQQQRLQKLPSGRSKLWCHFYLDEGMLVKGFDLAKKIIGHAGAGTRSIFDATGAKIRFRGKGSCHLEGRYEREAPVHLMLAVTADLEEVDGFREAVRLAAGHLRSVEDRFCHFCGRSGRPSPRPGACFWVGEISARGAACLEGVLGDLGLVVPGHP